MNRGRIERLKTMYPRGTRIELLQTMNDSQPVIAGAKGTVIMVDDAGTLHMQWDNGRTLALIPGEDSFRVLSANQEVTLKNEMSEQGEDKEQEMDKSMTMK